jgi:hypothetical protein
MLAANFLDYLPSQMIPDIFKQWLLLVTRLRAATAYFHCSSAVSSAPTALSVFSCRRSSIIATTLRQTLSNTPVSCKIVYDSADRGYLRICAIAQIRK